MYVSECDALYRMWATYAFLNFTHKDFTLEILGKMKHFVNHKFLLPQEYNAYGAQNEMLSICQQSSCYSDNSVALTTHLTAVFSGTHGSFKTSVQVLAIAIAIVSYFIRSMHTRLQKLHSFTFSNLRSQFKCNVNMTMDT